MTEQERIAALESELATQAHAAMRAQERAEAAEAQACRMKRVLERVTADEYWQKRLAFAKQGMGTAVEYGALPLDIEAALSASQSCPHAAEVERLRKLCGEARKYIKPVWFDEPGNRGQTITAREVTEMDTRLEAAEKGGGR